MNDPMSIVLCLPSGTEFFDPQRVETEKRDVVLTPEWDSHTQGVVGWSSGGWDALMLAAAHSDLPRLVIVSLPFPDDEILTVELGAVKAKTLLLFSSADPLAGSSHGRRWQQALPNARLEMVPGGDHGLLIPKWSRILSHLAPRRTSM